MYCLDVSNPDSPVLLKTFPIDTTDRSLAGSDNSVFDLVLSPDGQWLYVGDRKGDVQILRTSDPDGSVPILELPVIHPDNLQLFPVFGLALQDGLLYVSASSCGLVIFDVSDPAAASELGRTAFGSSIVKDVVVKGSSAFVADQARGVKIFDIADPVNPIRVSTVILPFYSRRLSLLGRYALISDWEGSFLIVDIGDPLKPALVISILEASGLG